MKKIYLLACALISIGLLGHLAGTITKGPLVTIDEIQERQLYGKTVTVNGRVVGSRLTVKMTPIIVIKDEKGGVMNVAITPGCTPPAMKMGYRYSFTGTPMSPTNMACSWPGAIKKLGEYELVRTITRPVYDKKFEGTDIPVDASNGWHRFKVWTDDSGREQLELVD